MLVYLNGEYLDHDHATVSVDDRGFLFGDGVYEVTRARNGRLFEPGRHLRRLGLGLEALGIAPPGTRGKSRCVAHSATAAAPGREHSRLISPRCSSGEEK